LHARDASPAWIRHRSSNPSSRALRSRKRNQRRGCQQQQCPNTERPDDFCVPAPLLSLLPFHGLTPVSEDLVFAFIFGVAVPLQTLLYPRKLRESAKPCQAERIYPRHRRNRSPSAPCASAKAPAAWASLPRRSVHGS